MLCVGIVSRILVYKRQEVREELRKHTDNHAYDICLVRSTREQRDLTGQFNVLCTVHHIVMCI